MELKLVTLVHLGLDTLCNLIALCIVGNSMQGPDAYRGFFANQYDICIFLPYRGFWLKASGRTAAFSSLGFHNIAANHDLLLDAHSSSALSVTVPPQRHSLTD